MTEAPARASCDVFTGRRTVPTLCKPRRVPQYPAKPPAHWLMVAAVAGQVLMVPLAPSDHNDSTRCRPIGCHVAAKHLADRYKEGR